MRNQPAISPRVKLAARLYATGAVPTKKEAAEAAGLNPGYFSVVTQPDHPKFNPAAGKLMDEIDQALHDKSIQTSALLELLGREALVKMRDLMKDDGNKAIQFKAAQDLLDRAPETSKIQKHAVAGFSLAGEDAKQIAAALVQAAHVRAVVGDSVLGDIVRIPVDPTQEELHDAGEELQANNDQVRQGNSGVSQGPNERGTGAAA